MRFSTSKSLVKILSAAIALSAPLAGFASGNTCVYVMGTVEGHSVTTPSVMVVVPDTVVNLGPLRVHVDGTDQSIAGYHIATPDLDFTTPGKSLFVPGVEEEIPSFSVTIHDVNVANKTCVSFGVTTPAVPIHVPASALTVPGAILETPEITVNTLGVSKTVAGQVITIEDETIIIPGVDETVPSLTVGTPDKTISVDINGALNSAKIMDAI